MLRCKTVDCHATIFSLHGHDGSSGGRAGHDRGETAKAYSHRATAIMFIILWHTRVRTCEYLHLASPFRPCIAGIIAPGRDAGTTASSNALPSLYATDSLRPRCPSISVDSRGEIKILMGSLIDGSRWIANISWLSWFLREASQASSYTQLTFRNRGVEDLVNFGGLGGLVGRDKIKNSDGIIVVSFMEIKYRDTV